VREDQTPDFKVDPSLWDLAPGLRAWDVGTITRCPSRAHTLIRIACADLCGPGLRPLLYERELADPAQTAPIPGPGAFEIQKRRELPY
jgi:hypothetical protein